MVFIPTPKQLEDLLNSTSTYSADSGYNDIIGGYGIAVRDGSGTVVAYAAPGSSVAPQVQAIVNERAAAQAAIAMQEALRTAVPGGPLPDVVSDPMPIPGASGLSSKFILGAVALGILLLWRH